MTNLGSLLGRHTHTHSLSLSFLFRFRVLPPAHLRGLVASLLEDFLSEVGLVESFVAINATAVKKILKKADKVRDQYFPFLSFPFFFFFFFFFKKKLSGTNISQPFLENEFAGSPLDTSLRKELTQMTAEAQLSLARLSNHDGLSMDINTSEMFVCNKFFFFFYIIFYFYTLLFF